MNNVRYSQYAYPDLKLGDQDFRWVHKYAFEVVNGIVPAGKWIKLACQRHLDDLERDDVYFDEEDAQHIVLFFKFIPITDGKDRGKPTELLPWQIFMVGCLAGWKRTETGLRKYKYCYCQVGRKNGKSTLSAGITLWFMLMTGYHRPRAYSVATKRDQAKELWTTSKLMIQASPVLKKVFKTQANEIKLPMLDGEFTPLSSDSNTLDGLNPIMINLDECHGIRDRNLYGVCVSSFGQQPEGMMLTITTAGTILDGICVDLNRNGKAVLSGQVEQDAYFYLIYEADDGDDWRDERVWYKANPALGFQPRLDYMRERAIEAGMSAGELINFKTKHLNLFVNGTDKWLDMDELHACKFDKRIEDYYGRECYVGFDMARLHDLTSWCLLFPNDQGGADCFYINALPRETFNSVSTFLRDVYTKGHEDGSLEFVETKTVSDDYICEKFRWINNHFDVVMFGYDPYKMSENAEKLEAEGLTMVSVAQRAGNMSEPAKKLEGLIKEQIYHYNDRLLEYAASCALLKITPEGNVKVIRENDKKDKIDPLISTIIALSCATLQKTDENIYERRGGELLFI